MNEFTIRSVSGQVKECWCIFSFKCRCDIKLFELGWIVEFHPLQMSRIDSFTSNFLSNALLYSCAMSIAGSFIFTGSTTPSAEWIGVQNTLHVWNIQWKTFSSGSVGDFQCLQLVLWITFVYIIRTVIKDFLGHRFFQLFINFFLLITIFYFLIIFFTYSNLFIF